MTSALYFGLLMSDRSLSSLEQLCAEFLKSTGQTGFPIFFEAVLGPVRKLKGHRVLKIKFDMISP